MEFYCFKEWPTYVLFLEQQKHFQVSQTVISEESCGCCFNSRCYCKNTSAVFLGCKLMRSGKERNHQLWFRGLFPVALSSVRPLELTWTGFSPNLVQIWLFHATQILQAQLSTSSRTRKNEVMDNEFGQMLRETIYMWCEADWRSAAGHKWVNRPTDPYVTYSEVDIHKCFMVVNFQTWLHLFLCRCLLGHKMTLPKHSQSVLKEELRQQRRSTTAQDCETPTKCQIHTRFINAA